MEFLLKTLGPKALLALLPSILIKVGNWFKSKDSNNTGSDDVFGDILIAIAPALSAIEDGNETATKKALELTYRCLGNYLGKNK